MPAMRILFWKGLAICLCQIDALSRAKHSALPGLYIARYGPQPRSHIERIDAERRPEGKLAGAVWRLDDPAGLAGAAGLLQVPRPRGRHSCYRSQARADARTPSRPKQMPAKVRNPPIADPQWSRTVGYRLRDPLEFVSRRRVDA
jgi:hypothetical protein